VTRLIFFATLPASHYSNGMGMRQFSHFRGKGNYMQNQKFAVQRNQLPRLVNDFFSYAGITRADR